MNPWLCNLLFNNSGGSSLPSTGRTFLMSKSSLILEEGTGGPTWSRATAAWRFNDIGLLRQIPSGCAEFGGARLVTNTVRTKSEDFSNAAWVKTALTTPSANTVLCANATSAQSITQSATLQPVSVGQVFIYGVRAQYVTGGVAYLQLSANGSGFGFSQYINVSLLNGSFNAVGCTGSVTLVSTGVYDISLKITAIATGNYDGFTIGLANSLSDTRFQAFVGDGVKSVTVLRAWSVDVTGRDASYIPEYVSVGVSLNTVRTTSEDFSNAAWTKTQLTVTGTNTLVCANNSSVLQRIAQDSVSASVSAGTYFRFCIRAKRVTGGVSFIQIAAGSVSFGASAYANFSLLDGTYSATGVECSSTLVLGTTDTYDFSIRALALVTNSAGDIFNTTLVNSLSDARSPMFVGDGVKSFQLLRAWSVNVSQFATSYVPPYYAVGVGTNVYFGAGIDGAKYFETDWQGAPIAAASLLGLRREAAATNNLLHCRDLSNAAWSTKTNITAEKTATGIDGIANTATTLTATAADAIILQPTSGIASAARCASAYVKRVTGTGTISFTQDGGSTWTDITSQINSSTWSRVQITATLANPSIGFKISTSGDAIDVDCVQNEAGSVATSPIVTTTATVTRNAESLSYQTSGNIDATVGSCYVMYSAYEEVSTFHRAIIGLSTVALTANALLYNALSVATTSLYSGDGTTSISKSGLLSAVNTPRKRAISWGGSTRLMTGDGVSSTSGAFSGTLPSTAIAIGGYTNGTNNISGYIGQVAIYNYKMTDAELQAITA